MTNAANLVFDRPPNTGHDDVLPLRAAVDLDVVAEQAARHELIEICESASPARWIVVFVGLNRYVDLRGLDVLLDATRTAAAAKRELLIVAPPRSLRRMVELLNLGESLRLVDSAWDVAGVIGSALSALPSAP